jgi:hypothetical protein
VLNRIFRNKPQYLQEDIIYIYLFIYLLSRVRGDFTRRGLDCQLDLLDLDTDTLNHSVYT